MCVAKMALRRFREFGGVAGGAFFGGAAEIGCAHVAPSLGEPSFGEPSLDGGSFDESLKSVGCADGLCFATFLGLRNSGLVIFGASWICVDSVGVGGTESFSPVGSAVGGGSGAKRREQARKILR